MLQDLRGAARIFRTRPAVALVAVLSLALGLGAVAGAVSLLDALGFRPPAVSNPDALVQIRALGGGSSGRTSYSDYEDLRVRARTFSGLAVYGIKGAGLSGPEGPPQVVLLGTVSLNYFDTLGVTPRIGRAFVPEDGAAGAPPVVLLSHRTWQRRFNGDPAVVGRTIDLNGAASLVIGILPREFTGLDAALAPDVWMPLTAWRTLVPGTGDLPEIGSREARWLTVVGRLDTAPSRTDRLRALAGFTPPALASAQSDIDVIAAALRQAYPATSRDQRFAVVSLATARAGRVLAVAILLWIVVGMVVLVGCANVAGLLLGRAEERKREMAIRVALGASPRRLVRQLLTESLALSAVSIAAGLLLGFCIIRSFPALLPPMGIPLGFEFRLDARAMLVTAAAGAFTVVVFGLWPAVTASRQAIAHAARGEGTGGGLRKRSPRAVLVVCQIAVSCVLLVSGGLLGRSALNSQAIDPGFEVRPLLLVSLSPIAAGYSMAASQTFFRDLVDRVSAAPGIERVSLARRIPLDPNGGGAARDIVLPGRPAPPDGSGLHVKFNSVLPGYFDVMGTRLVRGRAFTDRDGATGPKVVVINETMASRYWPDRTALGERIRVQGPGAGEFEVIGVVRDGKINRLTETPEPYMFFSLSQVPSAELTLIVQAGADPVRATVVVRNVLRELDPRMPTLQMLTLAQHMRYASYEARVAAILVASLSFAGLLLSLIGVYGVMSSTVASRTKEIGVRMALGAASADILREVMRRAFVLAMWGVGVGVAIALAVARVLAGSLYGVGPADPATFVAAAAALTCMAMLASWGPARRATLVDPIASLRAE